MHFRFVFSKGFVDNSRKSILLLPHLFRSSQWLALLIRILWISHIIIIIFFNVFYLAKKHTFSLSLIPCAEAKESLRYCVKTKERSYSVCWLRCYEYYISLLLIMLSSPSLLSHLGTVMWNEEIRTRKRKEILIHLVYGVVKLKYTKLQTFLNVIGVGDLQSFT